MASRRASKPGGAGVAGEHGDVVGQQRVERAHRRRLARVAGHLPPGVHARVGAPGDGQRHRVAAQDDAERALELALDRAQAGLARPAREAGPVVLDQQPCDRAELAGDAGRPQTSSSRTISVESERRGPSFRIRV